jgi:GT2 family glycosyltransferase
VSRLRPTEDGVALAPLPGALLAAAGAFEGRSAAVADADATAGDGGLPVVAVLGASHVDGRLPRCETDLYVLGPEVLSPIWVRGGSRSVARAIRTLRRRLAPALVAAPSALTDNFDDWRADVVVASLPPQAGDATLAALAAGLRAAGRPLLMDVRAPDTDPDAVVAALDVGAAGALFRTGDASADERIGASVAHREARRLDTCPLISVVVCAYNAADYLDECLRSLGGVRYPRFEVIVVDDGSTDDTAAVARRHDVRLVELEHGGLARARNAGVEAGEGEIVAFLDADAAAQERWLERIWRIMDRTGVAGAGGPNLPFTNVGWQERAVSGALGVAIPEVRRDGTCVHLPGCNMAFRRDAVLELGGFDERFVASHDDVDFCDRLLASGRRMALHPGATVFHHRRATLAGFIRQQQGYGVSRAIFEPPVTQPRTGLARSVLRVAIAPPRHYFSGPEVRQRYLVGRQVPSKLPLHVVRAILAAGIVGSVPAARHGRLGAWLWASGGVLVGALVAMLLRVPAFGAPRGPAGIAQRAATLALWLARPVVSSPAWRRLRRIR